MLQINCLDIDDFFGYNYFVSQHGLHVVFLCLQEKRSIQFTAIVLLQISCYMAIQKTVL